MTLNLSQTKRDWNPAKVKRTFKLLKETMNSTEMANLCEMLVAGGFINSAAIDLMVNPFTKEVK